LQEHEVSHHFSNSISEIKYGSFLHLFMHHTACVLKICGTKHIGVTDQRYIIYRWILKLYNAALNVACLWTSTFWSQRQRKCRYCVYLFLLYKEKDRVITSNVFDSKQDAEIPIQLIRPTITYINRNISLVNSRFVLTTA